MSERERKKFNDYLYLISIKNILFSNDSISPSESEKPEWKIDLDDEYVIVTKLSGVSYLEMLIHVRNKKTNLNEHFLNIYKCHSMIDMNLSRLGTIKCVMSMNKFQKVNFILCKVGKDRDSVFVNSLYTRENYESAYDNELIDNELFQKVKEQAKKDYLELKKIIDEDEGKTLNTKKLKVKRYFL